MKGLSPRGRGNRVSKSGVNHSVRSIPAWAGEPGPDAQQLYRARVYPRVGGGTAAGQGIHPASEGLSPRGRGNLL